jgi:hypothetical protein
MATNIPRKRPAAFRRRLPETILLSVAAAAYFAGRFAGLGVGGWWSASIIVWKIVAAASGAALALYALWRLRLRPRPWAQEGPYLFLAAFLAFLLFYPA